MPTSEVQWKCIWMDEPAAQRLSELACSRPQGEKSEEDRSELAMRIKPLILRFCSQSRWKSLLKQYGLRPGDAADELWWPVVQEIEKHPPRCHAPAAVLFLVLSCVRTRLINLLQQLRRQQRYRADDDMDSRPARVSGEQHLELKLRLGASARELAARMQGIPDGVVEQVADLVIEELGSRQDIVPYGKLPLKLRNSIQPHDHARIIYELGRSLREAIVA